MRSIHQKKDLEKFSICNRLISDGCIGSSSYIYKFFGIGNITVNNVNKEFYTKDDIVGVSVNGARPNRISFDKELIKKVAEAGARFVTDNLYNANRNFNIGERELASFLFYDLGFIVESEDEHRRVWKKRG